MPGLEEEEQVWIAAPGLDRPGKAGAVLATAHDGPQIGLRVEGSVDAESLPVLDDRGGSPVHGRVALTQAHQRHFEGGAVWELPFTVTAFLHSCVKHQLLGSLEIVFPPTSPNVLLDGVGIGGNQVAQALAG